MFTFENEGENHHRIKFYIPEVFMNDNPLNEGLIKTYEIDKCINYLNDEIKFPIVKSIHIYKDNPYDNRRNIFKDDDKRPSNDAFVGIFINKEYIDQYQELIQICYNLFGWFTGKIIVKYKYKNSNYRPITFEMDEDIKNGIFLDFDRGERYIPAKWMDKEKYFKKIEQDCFFWHSYNKKTNKTIDIEFNDFIKVYYDDVQTIEFVIEQKYPINSEYIYDNDEIFYHITKKDYLPRIKKYGIVPKSKYNYPDRIYLGFYQDGLQDMMEGREGYEKGNIAILKINLNHNQTLFRDNRRYDAVFTYDNISPEEIIEIIEDI